MNKLETQQAIKSLQAQIIEIQIRIAEERERNSEWAEATRLDRIAELRECIALLESDLLVKVGA